MEREIEIEIEIEAWGGSESSAGDGLERALAGALEAQGASKARERARAWMAARGTRARWRGTAWMLARARRDMAPERRWRVGAERVARIARWSDVERKALATWPPWLAREACEGAGEAGVGWGESESALRCARAKAARCGVALAECSAQALWRRVVRWPQGRGSPPLLVLAASAGALGRVPHGTQARWDAWEALEAQVEEGEGGLREAGAAIIAETADKITTRGATPGEVGAAKGRLAARGALVAACEGLGRALGQCRIGRRWTRSRRARARVALERWGRKLGPSIAAAAHGALEDRGLHTREVGSGPERWRAAMRAHLERRVAQAIEHAWTRACAREAALEGGESEAQALMEALAALGAERARISDWALATSASREEHARGARLVDSARACDGARVPERLRCAQVGALGRWSAGAVEALASAPAWLARSALEHLDDNDAARGHAGWVNAHHARLAGEHGLATERAGDEAQARALAQACGEWRWPSAQVPVLALARWLRAGRNPPSEDETWAALLEEEAALRAPASLVAHRAAAQRDDAASARAVERARDDYREGGRVDKAITRHATRAVERETGGGRAWAKRRLESQEAAWTRGHPRQPAALAAAGDGRSVGWRVACDTPARALAGRGAGGEGTPNEDEVMIIEIDADGPGRVRGIERARG